VTGRIKKPPVLPQEETSCHTKRHLNIGIQMDEEEMESAENTPLLQNAYNGDWQFVRKKAG
jgi:hypothetical protein